MRSQIKINLTNEILLYDATQILGLIATGYMQNPLNWFPDDANFILMGATHKTIPGPTSGLIMTNNLSLAETFDLKINPDYLRNVQLDNIVCLLFSLLELESFGIEYFTRMQQLINSVAKKLETNKMDIIKTRNGLYSSTHQLWLSMPEKKLLKFEQNAIIAGVSLNIRRRRIYNYHGVRLGFQQIARYNWEDKDAEIIATILLNLCDNSCNHPKIQQLINLLSPKKVHFTFDETILKSVHSILHNSNMQ